MSKKCEIAMNLQNEFELKPSHEVFEVNDVIQVNF